MDQDAPDQRVWAAPAAMASATTAGPQFDEISERVARLEAVLAASGGTLHDVNNLLTVLSGNLYLLTEAVRENPALLARCRSARNTAQRAATLIRELLSFARGADEAATIICPARHIQALEALLQRGMDGTHQVRIECSDDPWHVSASAAQLESAVTNLVLNAKEALTAPGTIGITVRNESIAGSPRGTATVAPGDYVCVAVTDDGPGIPENLLDRITEPLFTSKPRGKGNGMGLAMVRSFAERAGGCLAIDSETGRGTTVSIWLPRNRQQGDVTANLTVPISTLPSGEETVLLLTTDPDARATITQLLDALGYTVIQCSDREDGLRIAGDHPDLALAISERSHRMRTEEEAWLSALRRTHPTIRHMALIGPDSDAAAVAPDAHAYVRHPIGVPELARTIRSALEGN